MLSDGFWRRRFGADPAIVGQVDHVERAAGDGDRRAAGELSPPRDQSRARGRHLHRRSGFDPAQANRGGHFIRGVARLKDGVTVEQARAEIRNDCRPARAATIPIEQHRSRRDGHSAARLDGQRIAAGACCCCSAAVDRRAARGMRERRQPAAGARHRTACASSRCARRSAPIASSLVRQMLTESAGAQPARRRRRIAAGVLGDARADRAGRDRYAARRSDPPRFTVR